MRSTFRLPPDPRVHWRRGEHHDDQHDSWLFTSPTWSADLGLSPRECEIARLVARDRTNKEIAAILDISEWTVATHLRRMFAKLAVHSKAGMVACILDRVAERDTGRPPAVPDS